MGHRTTVERPITDKQRRVYEAALNNPGKPRAALARDLGVSREYIKQVLAVVQTKLAHNLART